MAVRFCPSAPKNMKKTERGYLTKNLPFEGNEEPPKPGDKGYVPPGWRFENGSWLDENDSVRDPETGDVLAERPSPELERARKLYPDKSKEFQAEMARILRSQNKAKK